MSQTGEFYRISGVFSLVLGR